MTVVESFAGHLPEWLEEELMTHEANSVGLGYFESTEEDKQRAHGDLFVGAASCQKSLKGKNR